MERARSLPHRPLWRACSVAAQAQAGSELTGAHTHPLWESHSQVPYTSRHTLDTLFWWARKIKGKNRVPSSPLE
jgi:hypothetical protein